MVMVECVGFFFFILVFGYFIPAWRAYNRYHVGTSQEQETRRIQSKIPTQKQIQREIWYSIQSIVIFSIGCTGLLELYKAGLTNIYAPVTSGPIWYAVLSLILCVFLHDTWFYWTHRFMHWRPVFKYMHLTHHRSVTPTPWAIFAFSPLEAICQFLGLSLLIIFLPMCPIVILLFLMYDTAVNVGGHTGFEIIPSWMERLPVFRWFNTVRHHDTHHTNVRVNYGSFLNVWDRWMGTFKDR